MIVEASIDACPEHLFEQVIRVLERVRVDAVAERETIYNNANFACVEVVPDQARDRSSDATVCRGIFGMAGSGAQREPIRVASQFGVTTAGLNGRHRSPNIIGKLRVPTSNRCVCKAGPQDRHQARRIHNTQFVVLNEVAEGASVLLACVLCSEQSNFALCVRANCTVGLPKEANLVVVVHPFLASEWRGPIGQELGGNGQRERAHLAKPGG